MSVRNPIQANEQAILALQRVSTGSSVHDTNGLIHTYRLCCAVGDPEMVEQAEREMYQRARKLAAQRPTCASASTLEGAA